MSKVSNSSEALNEHAKKTFQIETSLFSKNDLEAILNILHFILISYTTMMRA